MESSQQDMENLKVTVKFLKTELELQKQRTIKLEQYTRRENIRLLFVEEQPEENTEALFIRILTEMKVYRPRCNCMLFIVNLMVRGEHRAIGIHHSI